jgi:hypothetical protein
MLAVLALERFVSRWNWIAQENEMEESVSEKVREQASTFARTAKSRARDFAEQQKAAGVTKSVVLHTQWRWRLESSKGKCHWRPNTSRK